MHPFLSKLFHVDVLEGLAPPGEHELSDGDGVLFRPLAPDVEPPTADELFDVLQGRGESEALDRLAARTDWALGVREAMSAGYAFLVDLRHPRAAALGRIITWHLYSAPDDPRELASVVALARDLADRFDPEVAPRLVATSYLGDVTARALHQGSWHHVEGRSSRCPPVELPDGRAPWTTRRRLARAIARPATPSPDAATFEEAAEVLRAGDASDAPTAVLAARAVVALRAGPGDARVEAALLDPCRRGLAGEVVAPRLLEACLAGLGAASAGGLAPALLAYAVGERCPVVARAALDALDALGAPPDPALAADLGAWLDAEDAPTSLRVRAARGLGDLDGAYAGAALRRARASEEVAVRVAATAALGRRLAAGRGRACDVADGLDDPAREVRLAAARALAAGLGAPDPELLARLARARADERARAVRDTLDLALAPHGDDDAAERFVARLVEERVGVVQLEGKEQLLVITGAPDPDGVDGERVIAALGERAAEPVLRRLASDDPLPRELAAWAAAHVEAAGFVDRLLELLDRGVREDRSWAGHVERALSGRPERDRPRLEAAASDPGRPGRHVLARLLAAPSAC